MFSTSFRPGFRTASRSVRRATAGLIAAAALLGGAPAAHAAGAWLAPETISTASVATNPFPPALAFSPTGSALSAWDQSDDATASFASRARGGTWGADAVPTGAGSDVQLAYDGAGNAYAAWISDRRVFTSQRLVGQAWQTPAPLTAVPDGNNGPWASNLSLAVNAAGTAVLSWGIVNPTVTIWADAKPAGGVWQTPTQLSATADDAESAQAAIDTEGTAVVVFTNVVNQTGNDRLYSSMKVAGSNTWSTTPSTITTNDISRPDVAATSNANFTATWVESVTGGVAVKQSSRSTITAWSTPTTISNIATGIDSTPEIVSPGNGEATVVWEFLETTGAANFRVAAVSRAAPVGRATGVWGSQVVLSSVGVDAEDPAVAENPAGTTVVAWMGDHAIHGLLRPAGAAWPMPTDLSASSATLGYDQGPSAAIDADGNAIVAWPHSLSSGFSMKAAAFDAAAPTLGAIASVGGMAGMTVALSAPVTDAWGSPSVTWSFGDGSTGTGASTSHVFAAPGTYTVTATASDTAGTSAPQSTTVTIIAPPVDPGPSPTPDPTKNQLPPAVTPTPAPVITKVPAPRVSLKLAGAVLTFDTDLMPTGKTCPKASKLAFKVTGGSSTLKVKKHALKLAAAGKVCALTGTLTLSKTPSAKTKVSVALSAKGLSKAKLTATR